MAWPWHGLLCCLLQQPICLLCCIDMYPAPAVPRRLVFVAKGGTWEQARHRLWPEPFRAAARALLLAAHRSSSSAAGGVRSRGGQPWSSPAPAPFTPMAGRASQAQQQRQQRSSKRGPAADGSSGGAPAGLQDLSCDLLLHIIRLAALPMSAWMPL